MVKIEWKTCLKVGISVVLVYLFIFYFENFQHVLVKGLGATMPIFVGCIIAYIANIIMMSFERHFFPYSKNKVIKKLRRPLCLALSFIALFGIIVLIFSLILPQLISAVQLIFSEIPGAFEIAVSKIKKVDFLPQSVINELTQIDWNARIREFVEMVTSYFGDMMNLVFSVITSVFNGILSAFLAIVFSVYLLLSKDRLIRQANDVADNYFSHTLNKNIRYVIRVLNESFHNYIVGQSTEAVILGILCTIGMLALGLPYASMIGALVAFTALIPVVGALFGALVGAFMIFMVSPMDAFVFLVFIIILQQIEGNLIYPRVVGATVGLPALWVLAAVTIGGGILGVPGMLLGVPFASAVYRILRHDLKKKRRMAAESAAETVQEENGEAAENGAGA